MNASKSTFVRTPFAGFEQCVVACQLVHHTDGLNTDLIFVLVPCSEKGIPVSDAPVLLIASSPTEKKLMPLSVQQAELALEMMYDLAGENDYMNELLDINALRDARASLQDTTKPENLIVNLTEKVSVVLTPNTVSNTLWDVHLEISGVQMIPICLEFVGLASSNDNIKASFCLEDLTQDDLKSLRLLDDTLLLIDWGSGKQREYTGKCTKLEINDGFLVLTIESFTHEMRKNQLGHLSIIGFDVFDVVHLLGRNSGLGEDRINIEGFSPVRKAYTVTAPILNMQFSKAFGFGNVMFYPMGCFPDFVSIRDFLKDRSEVFEVNSLAVVHVEADTLFDALRDGIYQIEQVLDVILHIVRTDTVFKGVVTDSIIGTWDLDELTPHPILSTWVHVEEPFGGGQLVMDTSRIEQPDTLTFHSDIQNVLEQMEWYESLIRKLHETGDEGLKSLFNALKWLRRSWDAKDAEDKIIFANIALEFVASGEPSPPVIPKEFSKQVRNAAVDKFKELFEGEGKDKYIEKLNQKFADALNNAPLRVLVEGLAERNCIPISEADMRLIFEGRKIRNDLVHGRGASKTFTNTQNRKMVNAIGILASHKLKSFLLEDSH
ncbi:hypothetical protein J31TS6_61150 [Brevibacillus reuszeri]|nr:hypothetical protein J31TS6_61150 [Brevibacillus reuszeri]